MKSSNINKKAYFEGYYFKHVKDGNAIAFIPSIHIDNTGKKTCCLQIILKEKSYKIDCEFSKFNHSKNKIYIVFEDNVFSENGLKIDIKTADITIKGEIFYSNIISPKKNIMGFFRFFPFMQCRHDIISMQHQLRGHLEINGDIINFDDGIGYIEKDSGNSFPKSYLWTQCNSFSEECSIMASVADIPYLGLSFQGCICLIRYQKSEYCLATYKGVKIVECSKNKLVLKQGIYLFIVELNINSPQKLYAPQQGLMKRVVHENLCTNARYLFFEDNKLKFDLQSKSASFEQE